MNAVSIRPFHTAFPVDDLAVTRNFYQAILGCGIGREDKDWIDFDLFGHQISAHLRKKSVSPAIALHNAVDGDQVPVPHFGVILTMDQWRHLKDRLEKIDDVRWVIKPRIRFQGKVGEQATMFFLDPSGNALEFKAFANDEGIFQRS